MLMLEPVVFASLSWFMYNLPKANENLFRYVSLGALRTPEVINCSYDDILHTLWSLVLIHGLHYCSGFSTWQCGFTSDIVSHYYVFAQQATRLRILSPCDSCGWIKLEVSDAVYNFKSLKHWKHIYFVAFFCCDITSHFKDLSKLACAQHQQQQFYFFKVKLV